MTSRAIKLHSTAGVLRSGRKLRGYSQADVAKHLQVSQSWVSKAESAILMPDADQWFQICQLFAIDSEDSFRSGLIDNCQITVSDSKSIYPESWFKVPSKYRRDAASKVRAVQPFLRFFERQLGREKLEQYLKSEKIDSDFFLVMDNQISIRFLIKFLAELSRQGVVTPSGLQTLTGWIREPVAHGKLHRHYDRASNSREALRDLVQNSRYYEANFQYAVTDERKDDLTLMVTPHDHIDSHELWGENLGDLICRYKKEYFRQFASYGFLSAPPVKLIDRECIFRGHPRCIYEIRGVA